MALAKRTLHVWPGKLDAKSGNRSKTLGDWSLLENCFMQKSGELKKRFGTTAMVNTHTGIVPFTAPTRMSVLDDELVVRDVGLLYGFSESLNYWVQKAIGGGRSLRPASIFAIESKDVTNDENSAVQSADTWAMQGGVNITIFAYAQPDPATLLTTIVVAAMDNATGKVIARRSVEEGFHVRCAGLTDATCVFWERLSGGSLEIRALRIPSAVGLFTLGGAVTTIQSIVGGGLDNYDIQAVPSLSLYLLALEDSVALNTRLRSFDGSLALVSSNTLARLSDLSLGWCAWDHSDASAYLGSASTGVDGIRAIKITIAGMVVATDSFFAAVPGAGTLTHMTGYQIATTTHLVYDVLDTATEDIIFAATSLGAVNLIRAASLTGKCIKIGSNQYFWLRSSLRSTPETTALQDACYFVETETGGSSSDLTSIQSMALQGISFRNAGMVISNVSEQKNTGVGSGKYVSNFIKVTSTQGATGAKAAIVDTSGGQTMQDRTIGRNSLMIGGPLLTYDGFEVSEAGFLHFPDRITTTPGGGGALTPSTTYQYIVIWTHVDNRGMLHRSETSVPVSQPLTAIQNQILLTIRTLKLTERRTVTVEIYRTEANGDGSVLYRAGTVANNAGVENVLFTDSMSDLTLVTQPILYTNGGVLDATAPPQARLLAVSNNRVFLAGLENPSEVQFSKLLQPDVSAEFPDVFRFQLENEDGPITGLASLDDKLLIFKDSAIFFLAGDGPDDTGRGGYENPSRVATDVGCTNPRSIILMPDGVMFQSRKGFYLINRSMDTVYIGAQVEGLEGTTVDAVHVEDKNQVRFFTSQGNTLVYDYFFRQWYVFKPQPAKNAVWWKTLPVIFTTTNTFLSETTSWTDSGVFITVNLNTTEMSFEGVGNYQRVYEIQIVGRPFAHRLQATLFYNDTGFGPPEVVTVNAGTIAFTTIDQPYRFRIKPRVQKCESIRINLTLLDNGGDQTNSDFLLSGLAFLVGIKQGLGALPVDRYMI